LFTNGLLHGTVEIVPAVPLKERNLPGNPGPKSKV
jgi:hypothetical protein